MVRYSFLLVLIFLYSCSDKKEEIIETSNGAVHKVYHQFLEEELELAQKQLKLKKQAELETDLLNKWQKDKEKEINENPNKFIND